MRTNRRHRRRGKNPTAVPKGDSHTTGTYITGEGITTDGSRFHDAFARTTTGHLTQDDIKAIRKNIADAVSKMHATPVKPPPVTPPSSWPGVRSGHPWLLPGATTTTPTITTTTTTTTVATPPGPPITYIASQNGMLGIRTLDDNKPGTEPDILLTSQSGDTSGPFSFGGTNYHTLTPDQAIELARELLTHAQQAKKGPTP